MITVTATDTNGVAASDVIHVDADRVLPCRRIDGDVLRHRHRDRQPEYCPRPRARSRSSRPQGAAIEQPFSAPPRSRLTIAADAVAGHGEHRVFDRRRLGHRRAARRRAHDAVGCDRLRRSWRGSDRDRHRSGISPKARKVSSSTYVLLFNPHGEANRATVRYLRENALAAHADV